jgi:transketolase
MRNAYISALTELARSNKEVLSLVADNGAIVFDTFRKEMPEQFINFGISEASMVSAAAGLASCGKIPFAYTIAPFITMRAFEQVRNDVCLQQQNVKLVGVGAGMAYSALGPTHHACEDLALMRVLPGMTILVPASPKEAYQATLIAAKHCGAVYLRLEATREKEIYENDCLFTLGKGVILKNGQDLTFISCGSITSDVLEAAQTLEREGIGARVVNMPTIKPVDNDLIISAARETGAIITVEEHNVIGGLGSGVADTLVKHRCDVQFETLGLQDAFVKGYGSRAQLKKMNGLGVADMIRTAKALCNEKNR